MPPGSLGLNHISIKPKICHLNRWSCWLCGICTLCESSTQTLSAEVWCSQWTCDQEVWRKLTPTQNLLLFLLFQALVSLLCVCRSTRICLCFLFPFYRTECSERSCYCMCLMSHMEAVRLQECFGNIMPGTDNLSSSSFILSHCFCCHTHLELFTPLPREAGISLPHFLLSMG